MQLRVAPAALNLRSEPRVAPSNRIAVLPQGHLVTVLSEAPNLWRKVATFLDGSNAEGFVHSAYLVASNTVEETFDRVTAIHLQTDKADITPHTTAGRAFPIGDPGRPRSTAVTASERRRELDDIATYLDVEHSVRYAASGATTFCNVYAYDFCCLAGVYLPRVWWKGEALERLGRGEPVAALYDQTVRELRANDLYDWFTDYGERFGWRRLFDLDELQQQANEGFVGVIVAQRLLLGQPGHITVVVPERPDQAAARNDSKVARPLQSQAGASNLKYFTGARAWWQASKFRAFGFWTRS